MIYYTTKPKRVSSILKTKAFIFVKFCVFFFKYFFILDNSLDLRYNIK